MHVELIQKPTEVLTVIKALRKCHDSGDRMDSYVRQPSGETVIGPNDRQLIEKVLFPSPGDVAHDSTIEHSMFVFDVSGVSRALLQEQARHRIATGLSVQSTRYTLKKLLKANADDLEAMMLKTGCAALDSENLQHMAEVSHIINREGLKNDVAK